MFDDVDLGWFSPLTSGLPSTLASKGRWRLRTFSGAIAPDDVVNYDVTNGP